MDVDSTRDYCLYFPDATENLQWGDDLCFKVHGKIFAILSLAAVPGSLCFKCSPEDFAQLLEREDVRPAPYVGRYKWVLVKSLQALPERELKDLIRQSYEMVAAKAPKAKSRTSKPSNRRTKAGKVARTHARKKAS